MINYKKLNLYAIATKEKRAVRALAENSFESANNEFTREMYKHFMISHSFDNVYRITEETSKRIESMPILKDFSGLEFLSSKSMRADFVFLDNGLHFMYLITKKGIIISIGKGKYNTVLQDDKNKVLVEASIISGYLADVYIPYSNTPPIIATHSLLGDMVLYDVGTKSLSLNQNCIFKYATSIALWKKITKELEASSSTSDDTQLNLQESPTFSLYAKQLIHNAIYADYCIKAFLFLHTADVIDTTFIADDCNNTNGRGKHASNDVITIDSFWDKNIDVINPFSVKGHFRNQPFGENRKQSKLIYIDGFMKKGYSRAAKCLTTK